MHSYDSLYIYFFDDVKRSLFNPTFACVNNTRGGRLHYRRWFGAPTG
jgi:hypothetical protein